MRITVKQLGHNYSGKYLFRNISFVFEEKYKYAITGRNGSGKSTLIKLLASLFPPSEGEIIYTSQAASLERLDLLRKLNVVAPYIELEPLLTVAEQLRFYNHFKRNTRGYELDSLLALVELESSKNKLIRSLSSGMQQRIKLLLAFCFEGDVILLDEPTSYLDRAGIELYEKFITDFTTNRLLIIASNQYHEVKCCDRTIAL